MTIVTNNLIGYWNTKQGVDLQNQTWANLAPGQTTNATLQNMTLSNGALYGNGSWSNIQAPLTSNLVLTNNPFTIEVNVSAQNVAANPLIIDGWTSQWGSSYPYADMEQYGVTTGFPDADFTTMLWSWFDFQFLNYSFYNYALVYDGNFSLSLYIDGNLVSIASLSDPIALHHSAILPIGNNENPNLSFNFIRIYDAALTGAQLQQNFNEGTEVGIPVSNSETVNLNLSSLYNNNDKSFIYDSSYQDNRSQFIIYESELAAVGIVYGKEITALSFRPYSLASTTGDLENIRIRMKHTSSNIITSFDEDNLSLVYGPETIALSGLQNDVFYTHTFSTPFVYMGGNLLIETSKDDNSRISGNTYMRCYSVTTSRIYGKYGDNHTFPMTGGITSSNTNVIPEMLVTFGDADPSSLPQIADLNLGAVVARNNNNMPFRPYNPDYKLQFVVAGSQLRSLGITKGSTIANLQLMPSQQPTSLIENFRIRMGNTTSAVLNSSTGWATDMTLVYGPQGINPSTIMVDAPYTFILSQPFEYTGDNLIIEYSFESSSYGNTYGGNYAYDVGTDVVIRWFGSTTNAFPYDSMGATSIAVVPQTLLGFYQGNEPPNKPVTKYVWDNGYTLNKRPVLHMDVSDPDTDDTIVNAKVEIAGNMDFTNTIQSSEYSVSPNGWSGLPAVSGGEVTFQPQTDLPSGYYHLRFAVQDNNGAWSDWSDHRAFTVHFSTWTDTIAPGTGFKADWMNEISTAIINECKFRGLALPSFTDGTVTTNTDIKSIHITERRQALTELLALEGITPVWQDTELVDRNNQVIAELRNYCERL